ncbi:MAG: ABC transporter permease [Gammaproteobacteria bacterium]|nr:ABC transporter permease [Gammaproteobacteria bacterium]NNM14752.1 ABC transporter permease [Gammaproteobacteria bacterium]
MVKRKHATKAGKSRSSNKRKSTGQQSNSNNLSLAISQHLFHSHDTLKRLVREPLSSLMTIMVIAIALALPACLYLLVSNAEVLTDRWQTTHDISVYVDGAYPVDNVNAIQQSLSLRKDVQLVRVITSEQALQEMTQQSQMEMISTAIGENPLPHALIVSPSNSLINADSDQSLNELLAALKKLPGVNEVQLDAQWVMKLRSIIHLLNRTVGLLGLLLALGVLLVVSNTIRLHVQQRENEIQVKKLIGASNGFIRRPFLYLGFWYGILGAAVASILVMILLAFLSGPAARLAELYASDFNLQGLGTGGNLSLLFLGTGLALTGAFLAAEHTLKNIEVT